MTAEPLLPFWGWQITLDPGLARGSTVPQQTVLDSGHVRGSPLGLAAHSGSWNPLQASQPHESGPLRPSYMSRLPFNPSLTFHTCNSVETPSP